MRNLAQYPITQAEKIQAVQDALDQEMKRQAADPEYGSITASALKAVLNDLITLKVKP